MALDVVVIDCELICKDGGVSIVDRNGLFGVISCDGGGNRELDSVMQGASQLLKYE